MDRHEHWEQVYRTRQPTEVSWYAPHLSDSLRLIREAVPPDASIIDVGGGASTLVDDLLEAGYRRITVLDLSETALQRSRSRLGESAAAVTWLQADVSAATLPPAAYDLWHDRAVFHFLTSDDQRRRYVAQALKALKPGGFAIVGTFGPQGPEKCSGLQVSRYTPSELHGTFGEPFELLGSSIERHMTPWGSPQQFVYCYCRRAA